MMYVLSLIITYLIVFFIAIIPSDLSAEEVGLTVLSLAGLAGEVHYMLRHGRVDLNRYVQLPIVSVILGGVFAYAGIWIKVFVPEYRTEQRLQSYKELRNENLQRTFYVGGGGKGPLLKDLIFNSLPYQWRDERFFLGSNDAHRLYKQHTLAIGPLRDSVIPWIYFSTLDRRMADHIRTEYRELHHRISDYIDDLPSLLAAIAKDVPNRSREIGIIQPLYNHTMTEMREQLAQMEKDVMSFADIISNPSYWDITVDPPYLIRKEVVLWSKNIRQRVGLSISKIESAADLMLAYHVVLTTKEEIAP